jgi:ParB/RepB/Spo0J family partition protein
MAQKFEAKEIPIGQLYLNGINVRKELGDITDLENSIEAKGVLQPIVVRPGKGGKYAIIIGGRRFRAAKNVGLKTIPALVRDMKDEEAFAMSATENMKRDNLSPNDEAEMFHRALAMYGSQVAVAKALDVSEPEVRRQLGSYDLIHEFRETHPPHAADLRLPEDSTKTDRIHRASESIFPDSPAKRVELFEAVRDYPREDVKRALEYVKSVKETDPDILEDEPLKDVAARAFRVPHVGVTVNFDSHLSRAIIKAAEDRSVTWEDVVRISVEAWLQKEGFL